MVIHTPNPVYGRASDRKVLRQRGAMERAETYSKLTLDEKINEQIIFGGKQYKKLYAKRQASYGIISVQLEVERLGNECVELVRQQHERKALKGK